jgi:hypothetical protein
MIEEVARSMATVPHLSRLRKLIICDGVKVRDKNKFRSGEVTPERAAAYEQYKAELRRLAKVLWALSAERADCMLRMHR